MKNIQTKIDSPWGFLTFKSFNDFWEIYANRNSILDALEIIRINGR